ncbi:sigma-70 family RNA polymerase sigma factor [Streptomyces sp. NPDC023998]|uniref:RNA polymerase sigma factor n=1 Tax=Streptomyces sp. NPDC023998 TaxID=3154597 RepID=UPI0033D62368
MAENDHEVIERFRMGDWEAGKSLLDQYAPRLLSQARSKLRRWPDLAEDVVSQAFSALARYDKPIERLEPWLKKVVENRAVSEYRRLATEHRNLLEAGSKPELIGLLPGPRELASAREAEEHLATVTIWDDLLEALKPTDQDVMWQTLTGVWTGASTEEQARALGISTSTYRKKQQRARQRAQDALLVLHMSQPERQTCPELQAIFKPRRRAGVGGDEPAGKPDTAAVSVTPDVVENVLLHLRGCEDACREHHEELRKSQKLPALGALLPSPELRDRMRSICDEVRLENQAKTEGQKDRGADNPDNSGDAEAGRARVRTRAGHQDVLGAVSPPVRSGRTSLGLTRRVAKTIGAGVVAGLLIGVVVDKGEPNIGLPWQGLVPGVGTPADPGDSTEGVPGNDPKPQEGGGGTRNGGADNRGTDNAGTDNHSTDKHGTDNGGTDNAGKDNRGTDKHGTDNGGTDNGGTDNGGTDVPPEDRTGPSVSLAQISTSAVAQQVVDHHGSLMQTCGPPGTPATYSVWVAVSDPSGVAYVSLTIKHPSDGTYFSTDGVLDGGSVRFDVPAYRTGPKPLETVQLELSAMAKDVHGNRTKAGLGSLPLYECGEPG